MKIRQHLFAALVAVAAVTPALAGPPVAQTIEITAPRITSAAEIDGMYAMETGKRLEVQNYGDALRVVKVDVDLNSTVAAAYSIQTIPTIGLFKSGELTAQTHGAKKASVIENDLALKTVVEVGA